MVEHKEPTLEFCADEEQRHRVLVSRSKFLQES